MSVSDKAQLFAAQRSSILITAVAAYGLPLAASSDAMARKVLHPWPAVWQGLQRQHRALHRFFARRTCRLRSAHDHGRRGA